MVKVLSVPSHLPSWNGALFFSTIYCNACNVWNYWFWTISRDTVIYMLSFHIFHKHHEFHFQDKRCHLDEAHYLIPKHFKRASRVEWETAWKYFFKEEQRICVFWSCKSTQNLDFSNLPKLSHIPPKLTSLKSRRIITCFRVWLQWKAIQKINILKKW